MNENSLINEILKHKNDKGVLVSTFRDFNDYKHHIEDYKHPKYLLMADIRLDKNTYNKVFANVNNLNGGDK